MLLLNISQCVMSVTYFSDGRNFNSLCEPRKFSDETI